MKIAELMTRDVEVVSPDDTLHTAAKMMADLNAGVLPVGENDRLVGMITDRDIAVRGVAKGRDPEKTTVRDAMSGEVRYCFDDENPEEVARKMGSWQVRRLPVLNRDKRLVGIIALGDIALVQGGNGTGAALSGISRPGGQHVQV